MYRRDKQTGKQTDRQTGRQAGRQTDRQTDTFEISEMLRVSPVRKQRPYRLSCT